MHPFLDTTKLTDEEIIDRLGKAYVYMNNQVALGHTPTVMSIKEVIQSLENERRTRTEKVIEDEYNRKNPNELKPLDIGKIEL